MVYSLVILSLLHFLLKEHPLRIDGRIVVLQLLYFVVEVPLHIQKNEKVLYFFKFGLI